MEFGLTLDQIGTCYRLIAGTTTRYDFAAPVTREDLDHVRHELEAKLPHDQRVEVKLEFPYVAIAVFEPTGIRYYHRLMLVAGHEKASAPSQ